MCSYSLTINPLIYFMVIVMDTSEQYIKMCEKVFPYLNKYVPLFSKRRRMYYVVDGKVGLWWDIVNTSNCERAFPLWEQDQLQEMIEVINSETIAYFLSAIKHFEETTNRQFKSWEQLWLAFVMKEKFNKVWNGKGWING